MDKEDAIVRFFMTSKFSDSFHDDGINDNAKNMAGAEGLEPTDGGIKTRCLTTWRRPCCNCTIVAKYFTFTATHSLAGAVYRRAIDLHLAL
jgi:hypothetical protein